MTTLHPHWHAIDDADAQPVRVRVAKGSSEREPRVVSRRPAALVGITLVVLAGFLFVHQQNSGPTAQVSTNAVSIRITSTGLNPISVTVQPGQTIEWINEDTRPHLIASENLLTDTETPMETPGFFPGETASINIPSSAPAGTYTYFSRTKESINGSIVIAGAAVTPTTPTEGTGLPEGLSTIPRSASSSTPSLPSTTQELSGIPQNPYTVGTNLSPSVTNPYPNTGTPTYANAPYQPETGPGLWIVSFLSICAVLFVTRKAFRRV